MRIHDKASLLSALLGSALGAMVLVAMAVVGWMRADAQRAQQLDDLIQNVAHISQQVQTMQGELDDYLHQHDGH